MLGSMVLYSVLHRETANFLDAAAAKAHFDALLRSWELARFILQVKPSGSYAKGTAIKSSADIDLFISIDPNCGKTLKEIYDSLFNFIQARVRCRKQTVSVRCYFDNGVVDLVPARKNSGNFLDTDHWLYVTKRNTWQKTNVDTHISVVSRSGYADVMRLCKAWREKKGFEFPSLYLELVVIRALNGTNFVSLEDKFRAVLGWISRNIETAAFVDPANTNNPISDDLTNAEKTIVRRQAELALLSNNWQGVF
jgi:hypothetical protein